ncbi:hypothetical protein [Paenibacillus physcomitrellae]|uniref:Uncharacterized protein n=1 Tax=Paenibacillus physcomitrellae TaxID=1619311 RepID=A0ABQ1G4W8_9BACL|nr:hypothetical protein [Paenibacillus physcomitrellae]GGA36832.1 hypothetical protein GCM10010917_22430 [Paenibacillus physcomitrellae]
MNETSRSPHWDIVLKSAPRLLMDLKEPFQLIRAGVTIFEQSGPSPSFARTIEVDQKRVQFVIEYALFWDYDIQHLYDLEHVWIYVGHDGEVVSCEVSFHGRYLVGLLPDRSNLTDSGQVQVFVQPGKHAMSPLPEVFLLLPDARSSCMEEAGTGGVLEPDLFRGEFELNDLSDRLAENHLRAFTFRPAFAYAPFEWTPDMFIPWEQLRMEIPQRMRKLLAELELRG